MVRFAWMGLYFFLSILLAWRLVMPKPGLDARGEANWIEIAFQVILYIHVNLISLGIGRALLRILRLPSLTRFESILLEYLLGLGALSLGVAVLGFTGGLDPWVIFFWLAVLGIFAFWELWKTGFYGRMICLPKTRSPFLILLQVIALIAMPLLLIEGFSPVWDYDALLYHLDMPGHYLAQGKIYFDPDILRSAYPYLGEMLFAVGLAFNAASFAKLVNLTYGVLFVLGSYVCSRRYFGRQTAYTAAGILIGAPAYWMWATWAAVDFAWGVYEFWSLYAVVLWLNHGKADSSKWLALAGLMSGFAMGIKYLSIPAFLVITGIIAWKSREGSTRPVREMIKNISIFGSWAVAVSGVWYIHNLLVTGNPVYPLVFGGPGWDPLERQVLSDYVGSFGVGKGWLDYLLLPYNVYAFHDNFSTISLEIIHPALWLACLFPLVCKPRRRQGVLAAYACLGFAVWAITSQVVRFLIPLSAVLAILAGAVIESSQPLIKRLARYVLVGGFLLFNLIFQFQWLADQGAWSFVTGRQSAEEFLQNMSYGYDAILFIQANLDMDQKVRFLWDGRGYYCGSRCESDDEQSNAVVFAIGNPPPADLAADLRSEGVTHLLLSEPNANWFILYHDPQGMHRDAKRYFEEIFFPACGRLVYDSENGTRLYEIACR